MEQLLKILEDNARLPIEDIATMLNKSPAEVAAMIDLPGRRASSRATRPLWTGKRPGSTVWRPSSS